MEFKYLFYIILAVIFVGSKIFQGIKKANEELKERQRQNAQGPRPEQQQPDVQRRAPETIPDPWAEPKQATQPPKQKTIEEILAEMTRQYDQPTAAPAPKAPAPKPVVKRDQLNQPYPTLDNPYSNLDVPIPAVKKDYRFDDNMAMSSLSKKDYTNILEEHDTLDDNHGFSNEGFNPREAFKYAVLLERKYQ